MDARSRSIHPSAQSVTLPPPLLQVRRRVGDCRVLTLAPAPGERSGTADPPGSLSFGRRLQLSQHGSREHMNFELQGTTADCVLVAVDQTAGLMQRLGLAPVLTVVGVERGPALSSGETLEGGGARGRWCVYTGGWFVGRRPAGQQPQHSL